MAVLEMSFSAALLILVIVIIRALALHKLPKKTFLVLWGVALCRLLVPISIPSRFSAYSLVNMLKDKGSGIDTPYFITAMPDMVTAAGRADNTSWTDMAAVTVSPIMAVWMAGLLGCALFFLVTHLRCRREYRTALPIESEFVTRWQQEHPTKRKVELRQSDIIAAPLTYGILRPVVLLPKTTDWADETRLRYILAHEFVHIRRFDILTKLLLAAAVCVHWFNPFVWAMYVLANRDIELSCDEAVVRTFGETIKSAYALTLIGLEEKKSRLTPLVNNFSKNAIEERIVSIMKIKKTSLTGIILALVLVAGTVTIFATSAAADKEPASGNVTIAGEAAYVETPESKAEMYARYEQYGLTYNKSTDQLFFNGELVRYFEDYYPVGDNEDGVYSGIDYFNENGTIDVQGVRDLSQLTLNPDGSTDPSGKLIGIEPYSQADFDARNIEELKNPPMQATSVDDSSAADNSSTAQELPDDSPFSGYTYAAESGPKLTPDEYAKLYSIYEPFGVTYDKKQDCFYYNGKLVRQFVDVLASNGESFSGGKFKGAMRQMGSPDGEIEIEAIRDYTKPDANGYGALIGIEVVK